MARRVNTMPVNTSRATTKIFQIPKYAMPSAMNVLRAASNISADDDTTSATTR